MGPQRFQAPTPSGSPVPQPFCEDRNPQCSLMGPSKGRAMSPRYTEPGPPSSGFTGTDRQQNCHSVSLLPRRFTPNSLPKTEWLTEPSFGSSPFTFMMM